LPAAVASEPAFHNDSPLEFGKKDVPEVLSESMDALEPVPEVVPEVAMEVADEDQTTPEQPQSAEDSQDGLLLGAAEAAGVPTYMKPLPDEQEFGKDMALSVALEMEEKRRWDKKNMPAEVKIKKSFSAVGRAVGLRITLTHFHSYYRDIWTF
jgi:hypothetical protein